MCWMKYSILGYETDFGGTLEYPTFVGMLLFHESKKHEASLMFQKCCSASGIRAKMKVVQVDMKGEDVFHHNLTHKELTHV